MHQKPGRFGQECIESILPSPLILDPVQAGTSLSTNWLLHRFEYDRKASVPGRGYPDKHVTIAHYICDEDVIM